MTRVKVMGPTCGVWGSKASTGSPKTRQQTHLTVVAGDFWQDPLSAERPVTEPLWEVATGRTDAPEAPLEGRGVQVLGAIMKDSTSSTEPMKPICYRYPQVGMAYGTVEWIHLRCIRRPGIEERA
jgi:hypothetical protein